MSRSWLAERLGMRREQALAFVDFIALVTLARLRRLGGAAPASWGCTAGGATRSIGRPSPARWGCSPGSAYRKRCYLTSVDDGMYAGSYLRAMMLGAALGEALGTTPRGGLVARAQRPAPTSAGSCRRGLDWNAEQVVAHLGYDSLDWRPVLRKIRTQLIGEMSGYGGPNITTRAGTRKI